MKRSFPWLAAGGLAVAGCSQPSTETPPQALEISSQSAALTANQVVTTHLDDLAKALVAMQDSKLLGRVFPKSDATSCDGTTPPSPSPDPAPPGGGTPAPCTPAPAKSPLDTTQQMKDAEDWLAKHVFTDANVEANGPGADAFHVVFRLQPAVFCEKAKDDAGNETVDADCTKTLTEVPVRLTASSLAAGDLDLALTIGSTHPADIALHHDAVRVAVSLAEAKAAYLALAAPTKADVASVPETFTGRVQLDVTRLAAADYQVAFSIAEALSIASKPATDPAHYDVTLAAHNDVAKLRVTGATHAALASLDFGAFDAMAALNFLDPRSDSTTCPASDDGQPPPPCTTTPAEKRTGTIALHLGGLSVGADMNAAADTLKLVGLGLGNESSWLKYNGTQIATLDVNASAGRRFDLEITDADTGATVSFDPSLAASVAYDLATILPQMDDSLPKWMTTGSLAVSFTGTKPTFQEVKTTNAPPSVPTCDTMGNCTQPPPVPSKYLRMTSGTMTIEASGYPSVVVAAPQCLVEVAAAEGQEHTHPVQDFGAGACE